MQRGLSAIAEHLVVSCAEIIKFANVVDWDVKPILSITNLSCRLQDCLNAAA